MLKLGEAADRLGVSRETLQQFLATYTVDKNGVAYYRLVNGRRMFDANDIDRIRDALGRKTVSRFYSER
jgi:DNA-binding transcriptional MerR regulator